MPDEIPSLGFNQMAERYLTVDANPRGKFAMPRTRFNLNQITDKGLYRLGGVVDPNSNYTRLKTGADLFFNKEGLIINRLGLYQAELWTELAGGLPDPETIASTNPNFIYIPIAPILVNKNDQPRVIFGSRKARVISRFCGFNQNHIDDCLYDLTHDPQYLSTPKLEHQIEAFQSEIRHQRQLIVYQLNQLGLRHGGPNPDSNHTRADNFTVEFIQKDAYKKYYQNRPELNSRYRPNEITFDLAQYFSNPDQFQVVVRIIDFDLLDFFCRPVNIYLEPLVKSPYLLDKNINSNSFYLRNLAVSAISKYEVSFNPLVLATVLSPHLEHFLAANSHSLGRYLGRSGTVWQQPIVGKLVKLSQSSDELVSQEARIAFSCAFNCPPETRQYLSDLLRQNQINRQELEIISLNHPTLKSLLK